MKRSTTLLLPLAIVSVAAAAALGEWSAGGEGSAAGAASTMPGGNAPTARASGNVVAVTWLAASFPDGTNVAGYTVRRYNAATGAPGTVGGSCSGVVTATTCTDQPVPNGSWVYADTPVQLTWTGAESPAGNTVTTLS